jgi:hypothetical protein
MTRNVFRDLALATRKGPEPSPPIGLRVAREQPDRHSPGQNWANNKTPADSTHAEQCTQVAGYS